MSERLKNNVKVEVYKENMDEVRQTVMSSLCQSCSVLRCYLGPRQRFAIERMCTAPEPSVTCLLSDDFQVQYWDDDVRDIVDIHRYICPHTTMYLILLNICATEVPAFSLLFFEHAMATYM